MFVCGLFPLKMTKHTVRESGKHVHTHTHTGKMAAVQREKERERDTCHYGRTSHTGREANPVMLDRLTRRTF